MGTGRWCASAPRLQACRGHLASFVHGVGGNSDGMLDLLSYIGVECGVRSVIRQLHLRPGVFTSKSGIGICTRGGGTWIEGGGGLGALSCRG